MLSNRGGMHRMTVKREEPQESRATPINQRLTTGLLTPIFPFLLFLLGSPALEHATTPTAYTLVHENTAKTLNCWETNLSYFCEPILLRGENRSRECGSTNVEFQVNFLFDREIESCLTDKTNKAHKVTFFRLFKMYCCL